jgi:hypothetical protein
MGATAGEFEGWSPAGKVSVHSPSFLQKRGSGEGIALCFVDGRLGTQLTDAQMALANASDFQRALYLIGEDGIPVLYAFGKVDDLHLQSPAVKAKQREYPTEIKRGRPPESVLANESKMPKAGKAPETVPNEDAPVQTTSIPDLWKKALEERRAPVPSSTVAGTEGKK